MIRKIIKIDGQRCNGCGLCAIACHEGAIGIVDGKARLLRENYCDGLGDCLPACPMNAISFEEREAPAYDEEAVKRSKESGKKPQSSELGTVSGENSSRLRQWPVQLKLAPVHAGFFDKAHVLVAADCTAYAYGSFHEDFIKGRVTLIGCPKLDGADYAEKLAEIFAANDIKSVTLARMEVPCCGGLERAVKLALHAAGKLIPLKTVTITTDGGIKL